MQNASFLPEDYIAQTAERRTNLLSVLLFGIVMTAVFGAFLVTNRQWTQVRTEQVRINADTEKAAGEIRKMQELEEKRGQMIEKAELAMTLIEPIPRSVLLALLVNAMPERLSLLEFDLRSEEIKRPKRPAPTADAKKPAAQAPRVAARGRTKAEAAASGAEKEAPKPDPVRYLIGVTMTGVAPSDLEVSRYMNALSSIPILRAVRLEATEEKDVDGMTLRQFRISMRIDHDADIRTLKQSVPRPDDPMGDRMKLAPPAPIAGVGTDAGPSSEESRP
jgi:Tfp pilus assembly protein PilN